MINRQLATSHGIANIDSSLGVAKTTRHPIPPETLAHRMVVRVQHKFRQRMIEWLAATQLLLLGLIMLHPDKTFESNPSFLAMSQWMSETSWGWFLLSIGASGIIGLFVNGSMESVTPWIRVIRAMIGAVAFSMIASSMFISWVVYQNPPSTGMGVYFPMVAFEIAAIYCAIIDARIYQNGRRDRRTPSKSAV